MKKKRKELILNHSQILELRWFSRNCTGTRQEYYRLLDEFLAFKNKLDRLEQTAKMIEKYFKKHGIKKRGEFL